MSHYDPNVPTARVRGTGPTAASGETRPGVRVTPLMLSGVMAVVVLMLFTVIFLLTREPEPAKSAAIAVPTEQEPQPSAPPADKPSEQAPSEEPVPTGESKYTKEFDPCPMIPEDMLKKYVLYPDETQIYREECKWVTIPGQGGQLPNNMTHRLELYIKMFPEGVAKAHEQLIARREDSKLLSQSFTKTDPPIGDDSFITLYTLDPDRGPTTATVGVRLSNVVVEVAYQRNATKDNEGRLTKGAIEMAKAVADKVAAGG